jgi:hypothetical protein
VLCLCELSTCKPLCCGDSLGVGGGPPSFSMPALLQHCWHGETSSAPAATFRAAALEPRCGSAFSPAQALAVSALHDVPQFMASRCQLSLRSFHWRVWIRIFKVQRLGHTFPAPSHAPSARSCPSAQEGQKGKHREAEQSQSPRHSRDTQHWRTDPDRRPLGA